MSGASASFTRDVSHPSVRRSDDDAEDLLDRREPAQHLGQAGVAQR